MYIYTSSNVVALKTQVLASSVHTTPVVGDDTQCGYTSTVERK